MASRYSESRGRLFVWAWSQMHVLGCVGLSAHDHEHESPSLSVVCYFV